MRAAPKWMTAARLLENIEEVSEMKLNYKLLPEGDVKGSKVPVSIAFVDYHDVVACGITMKRACDAIAAQISGPGAIHMFDMDAVTTNSDGIMIPGSMTCMAACDYGRIDPEFGFTELMGVPHDEQLIREEPHLRQWDINFPGHRLILGPDPDNKPLPVHNAVISGRSCTNNSATEVMNCVTMDEMLLFITGQMEVMKGKDILWGKTGEVISVGIGMLVGEEYGRIVPHRQYICGDTGHKSGVYAKYLKNKLPCLAAPKRVLAEHIILALKAGMIPGRHVGPSPAVLTVAKYLGYEIDCDNITPGAYLELGDVGIQEEWVRTPMAPISEEEFLARVEELLPGTEHGTLYPASELTEARSVEV